MSYYAQMAVPTGVGVALTAQDTFTAGTLSASWAASYPAGTSVASGRLTVTGDATDNFPRVTRVEARSLAANGAFVRWQIPVVDLVAGHDAWWSWSPTGSTQMFDGLGGVGFYWNGDGNLYPVENLPGGSYAPQAGFAFTAGMWVQIIRSGATLLLQSAPNVSGAPGTWTTRGTATSPQSYWSSGISTFDVRGGDGTFLTVDNWSTNAPASPLSPLTGSPSILRDEVFSTDGSPGGDGGNAHGGHQIRVVTLPSGDLFGTYLRPEATPSTPPRTHPVTVRWRRPSTGAWQHVMATDGNTQGEHESGSMIALPDGTVQLVAWVNPYDQPRTWTITPNLSTGVATVTGPVASPDPTRADPDWITQGIVWSNYMAVAIAPDGAMLAQISYGAQGAIPITVFGRRPPGSTNWKVNQINLSSAGSAVGRWHYAHIAPARTGNGMYFVGSRSDDYARLGMTTPVTVGSNINSNQGYVYDAVRVFYNADITTATDTNWVHAEVNRMPQSGGDEPQCFNGNMGAHVDKEGRMHIGYIIKGNGTPTAGTGSPGGAMQLRHAVYAAGGVTKISDVLLETFPTSIGLNWQGLAMDFMENANGELFMARFQHGSTSVRIMNFHDRSVGTPTSEWTVNLAVAANYPGVGRSSYRSGSPAADFVDWLQFTSAITERYVRVGLPSGGG